jgi:Tol biopolymer transport system component
MKPTPIRFYFLLILFTISTAGLSQDPALIPRQIIDAPAEHDLLTISPDGKTIAYTAPSEQGVANVWVEDLATHQKRMVTRAGHRGIGGYQWAYDNQHLLIYRTKTETRIHTFILSI